MKYKDKPYAKNSIKNTNYVQIKGLDNKYYFGGRQNWFSNNKLYTDNILREYGCGVIAAGDLFLYLALQDDNNRNDLTKIAIKGSTINQIDYMGYIITVNKTYTKAKKHLGVLGPKLASAINSYFKYAGINYKARWAMSLSSTEMLSKIIEMLEKDIPVILSVGPNTPNIRGKDEINLYTSFAQSNDDYIVSGNELNQYKLQGTVNRHYMVITELIKNNSTSNNDIMLKVSSWGKDYYINYDEYRGYVEDIGGKITSSIIYIK